MATRKEELRAYLLETEAEMQDTLPHIGDDSAVSSTENPEWRVRDILAHLLGSETGQQGTIQMFLRGEALRPDFDLNRYNAGQVRKSQDKSLAELKQGLLQTRKATLALLDSLSEEQLAAKGKHASGLPTDVGGVFRIIAHHQHNHFQEIRSALGLSRSEIRSYEDARVS